MKVILIVSHICSVFTNSADHAYGKTKTKTHRESTNTQKGKPWFGAQCANARRDFHKAKKQFDNVKTEHNKTNLKHKGKAYKKQSTNTIAATLIHTQTDYVTLRKGTRSCIEKNHKKEKKQSHKFQPMHSTNS